jgi:hypothetical protein
MTTDVSFDGRVFKLNREAEFRGGNRFLNLQEILDPRDAGPTRDAGLPFNRFPSPWSRVEEPAVEARAEPVSRGAGFASPHLMDVGWRAMLPGSCLAVRWQDFTAEEKAGLRTVEDVVVQEREGPAPV